MKIGFTGTQEGMTGEQCSVLASILLQELRKDWSNEFHHGCCIGADWQAHRIVRSLFITFRELRGWENNIIIHPPKDESRKADIIDNFGIIFKEPKPYLQRNKDIVDETDLLIACPNTKKEVLRSGTWSTVRYARKRKKEVLIIYPDGKCG